MTPNWLVGLPTIEQAIEYFNKNSEKKPKSAELQKSVITQAKKTEKRAWLSEVSNIPFPKIYSVV
ncbi:MAG: hypothetical protein HC941_08025 [Microcoleus sp. SU_5_3]|nr:hypothetical protein [Microcoleus sp. SU_5_3]